MSSKRIVPLILINIHQAIELCMNCKIYITAPNLVFWTLDPLRTSLIFSGKATRSNDVNHLAKSVLVNVTERILPKAAETPFKNAAAVEFRQLGYSKRREG